MMIGRLVLVLALVLVPVVGSAQTLTDAGRAALSAFLQEAVDDGRIPGVVALVTSDDDVLYHEAFGWRDVGAAVAMPRDAIFNMASMTKPVTSVAIMMLMEEGRLELDDPVARFLPEFEGREVIERFDAAKGTYDTRPARRPITIRHLLTHTSGIGYAFSNPIVARLQEITMQPPEALPLLTDPGDRWAYGASTAVLGRVVEAISGQTLDAFFDARILGPLDMVDTGYAVPTAKRDRVVTSHQRADGGLTERAVPDRLGGPARGDGGLYSTASDYGRFVRLLLKGGALDGVRLLTDETVASLTRNHIGDVVVEEQPAVTPPLSLAFPLGAGHDTFGLGFQVATRARENRRSVGSGSWAGIFNTHFWIDPARDVGVVLLLQVLPFYDDGCIAVLTGVEELVYQHLN